MANLRVIVVGGGLAGLAATMKLAELECDVSVMSLAPLRRSHSCCAQGGINSVNDLTRQLDDSEWKHFEDTVYGGEFLQHQPPVREMVDWAPRIIDLLDRLGVTFNRTHEGFRDQRRFGGTLYRRTAFAGATTGQQLLYALDEQVRRWSVAGKATKYEFWDFLGPILDDQGRCRGCVAQNMVNMEIRALPADAVIVASGGAGLIFGKSTNSLACSASVQSRCFQAGAAYANPEFIQVHPTAIPGADKLRLISESVRGEGGRIWVPRKPQDPRPPQQIPENERFYFLEERYPTYGNLVPRDIAAREVFDVCVREGLSVEKGRLCVYLDVTHLPCDLLERKLGGVLEIYRKFQGADPCSVPMKIFPAVHYTMGGLWCDYQRSPSGGLAIGSPRNQQTNIPGLFAIGECEYQYHGANRLGANSLVACIFSGLIVAPSVIHYVGSLSGKDAGQPAALGEQARRRCEARYSELIARPKNDANPYRVHAELGRVMTEAATVVRRNKDLAAAYGVVEDLEQKARRCALADTGDWLNQNAVFTRALEDMFPVAKAILKGALARDECRGAHYKPEFAIADVGDDAGGEDGHRRAVQWVDEFESHTRKWLKTTVAALSPDGQPVIRYEDVDTSLLPPRPRLYGGAGAKLVEQVWKERQARKSPQPTQS